MAISDQDYEAAKARGRQLRAHTPPVLHVRHEEGLIIIQFGNGMILSVPVESVQDLAPHVGLTGLNRIQIEAAGLGLHWPDLDVDLYVPALLEGITGNRAWMASQLGAAGGAAKSDAKAAAARANGLKGGRPRKSQPA